VTASTVTNLQIGVSPCAPVRKQQEIAPVQMTEPRPGVYVFNLTKGDRLFIQGLPKNLWVRQG